MKFPWTLRKEFVAIADDMRRRPENWKRNRYDPEVIFWNKTAGIVVWVSWFIGGIAEPELVHSSWREWWILRKAGQSLPTIEVETIMDALRKSDRSAK